MEWEPFACSLLPGANMAIIALRDDAGSILRATVRDTPNCQSREQQASKSKRGRRGRHRGERLTRRCVGIARRGASWLRFHITDVVPDPVLRASVLRLRRESLPQPNLHDIDDITRFD